MAAMGARKPGAAAIDAKRAIEEYQDHLAPRLDVYEQALYLYLLRHSRLVGKPQVTVEVKAVRGAIGLGPGPRGGPISEKTALTKLRSLKAKGCLDLLEPRDDGTEVRLLLPSEIPGLMSDADRAVAGPAPDELDGQDFVNVPRHRRMILQREGGRCFYCLKKVAESSFVVDQVRGRLSGDVGWRDVVACCRRCNSRKGDSSGEGLLRVLYREGCIPARELSLRLAALDQLRAGELRP